MNILKVILFFLFVSLVNNSFGQRKPRTTPVKSPVNRRNPPTRTNNQQPQPPKPTEAGSTPKKPQSQAPSYPIEIAKSSGNGSGINDSVKQSQRVDNIIDRNLVKDRTPLVYEHIREDDAVYKQRVWREIDTREKINLAFRYSLIENNGSQRFINILINALKSGVQAFAADEDDRFTTPITLEKALATFGSKIDTSYSYDLDGNITKAVVAPHFVDLDSVYKYRVKEEVVFDKESSRLFTRILGICPVMPVLLADNSSTGEMRPLFWLYYPDLRPILARYECYNPKNFGARMSWEDLFEGRMFSSYITKSTIDNPFNKSLKEKYGKNTLFMLLEGDAIKEKIFNYEQDLWSY